jgi:hypothetical protein
MKTSNKLLLGLLAFILIVMTAGVIYFRIRHTG